MMLFRFLDVVMPEEMFPSTQPTEVEVLQGAEENLPSLPDQTMTILILVAILLVVSSILIFRKVKRNQPVDAQADDTDYTAES